MTDRIFRFFATFKLMFVLLVMTGIFSAVGTFIPQGEDNAEQVVAKYGQVAYDRLHMLGITDTYHSWWFFLVLLLFTLNLAACTLVRLPKVWRMHKSLEEAEEPELHIPQTNFELRFASELSPLEAADAVRKRLEGSLARCQDAQGKNGRVLAAEKHTLSLWGAYIVHAGLFMLIGAGFLRVMFGYSKYMYVLEGSKAFIPREEVQFGLWIDPLPVPKTSWTLPLPRFYQRVPSHSMTEILLDKFDVQYYPGTAMPSLFRSDVKIVEGGAVIKAASLKVNEPLTVGAVTLYQSSYGYQGLNSADLELRLPGSKDVFQVTAPYRKRFKLLDSGWEMEITDFYPEADMAKPGEIVQTGAQLNNPAIRVKFFKKGVQKAWFWYVYAYPSIQMSKVPGLEIKGKTLDPVAFTVLQAAHDPGEWLALSGALVLLLGVFASFYLFYRKFWVVVSPREGGGSLIRVVGNSKRNKMGFRKMFEGVSSQIKGDLHGF
ncbi:MAG: cytochrome c biogenesis protein ResB [candidate division FCPU426 bacterium]